MKRSSGARDPHRKDTLVMQTVNSTVRLTSSKMDESVVGWSAGKFTTHTANRETVISEVKNTTAFFFYI